MNAEKGAYNEARISEEEHVGIRESKIKGCFWNIQTRNQMKTVVMRRRINYLCVVGKLTLKI